MLLGKDILPVRIACLGVSVFTAFAVLVGCSEPSGVKRASEQGASPLTASADVAPERPSPVPAAMSGEQASGYVGARAKQIIRTWRPLEFSGALKAYAPGDFGSPAAERLLREACKGNRVWRTVQSFRDLMGEIPTAADTPSGPVLFEAYWEKGTSNRSTYMGVRVEDGACGGVDIREDGKVVIDGEGDVVALLVAAAALKGAGGDRDGSVAPAEVREHAVRLIAEIVGPAETSGIPAGPGRQYSATYFRTFLSGKTRQQVIGALGPPLAINDGVTPGAQSYDYSSDETYLGRVPFRVVDDVTGLVLRSVHIEFGATGVVTGVTL